MSFDARREAGSAVVDFVLLTVVLIPLVLGILHVALVLHVRNTLVSAASEGARHAARLDRGPADGVRRARQEVSGALSSAFAQEVTARPEQVAGMPGIAVTIRAGVPPLGLWGPATPITATGHAIEEGVR